MKTHVLPFRLLPAILFPYALMLNVGAQVTNCHPPLSATFTVQLPRVGLPPDEEGQGWIRPPVWQHLPNATDDAITVPNGRPIYALLVSGYAVNSRLDTLTYYNFARHLMAQGAYVHYAWWNNLLAPYMERPLHHSQSHPGDLTANLLNFATAELAAQKGAPGEDYQFIADARRFLSAIRQHNPRAMIILVGHSMGGGAVVHLGSQTDVVIDILAPIDPVGNRNYPWAGFEPQRSDFNWTRWRVSRDRFLGYQSADWGGLGVGCVPTGPWLKDESERSNDIRCAGRIFVHDAPTLHFGSHIINLHHRYQKEALFPFDFGDDYAFGHSPPPNGTSSQAAVQMSPAFCGLSRCSDPGGWPGGNAGKNCCPEGDGIGWGNDGHGEIVGYRGPGDPVPLGVRVRTSPDCGDCPNQTWPARSYANGTWSNGNSASRVALLQALETHPASVAWPHRPANPDLCLVSPGLIQRFNTMNKPPLANAGPDQALECTGPGSTPATLNGSGSSDSDGDLLQYTWTWDSGTTNGAVIRVSLPKGTNCFTLTVKDPSGHMDRDTVAVIVADTTPPELSVKLSPQLLWPPNHKLVKIRAQVAATDLCGNVTNMTLLAIVSNQPDDKIGDGKTTGDIVAKIGTLDQQFQLRAERAGPGRDRIYTVTYQATDDSGNQARVSENVIVPHDARSFRTWAKAKKK